MKRVVIWKVPDTLGLNHLVAWTIDYNEDFQALLRRLGFTHEGTSREHVFRKGEYRDTEQYGLLADEWAGSEAIPDEHSPDRFDGSNSPAGDVLA